ncbi:MAG: hypothetical protein C0596_05070 [Marinilabiliales bacterium]|nr:MAG: hypothetical protein C0596_05070 [Marinilabiliales bacterium]
MKSTSILLSISIAIFAFILSSCDDDIEPYEDSESIDCEWCFEELPEYVDLELIFNTEASDTCVFFTVYSGYAFASDIYMTDTSTLNSIWIGVKPDQKYTVVAEYIRGEEKIHVINDAKVKTEFYNYACDEPCHYVYEASCDLKLKY